MNFVRYNIFEKITPILKKTFLILFCFSPLFQFAQDFSEFWEGHFSYSNVKQIVKGNDKIYAAAENAIFIIDLVSNDIQELTSVNGLSGETISTIYYSDLYELLIIGYENGLLEIVFDENDEVLSIVDILDKSIIQPDNKRINHFNPYNNLIYISTNFGISVYDLENLEFGDTYFIGNGGTQIRVSQTTIFNDFIYASCIDENNGLRKGDISSNNLIDFNNWDIITSGNFIGIKNNENKLYTINSNGILYEVTNDILNQVFNYDDIPVEIQSINTNLIVSTSKNIFIYDNNFNLLYEAAVSADFPTEFNSAIIDNNNIYIGTKNFGILKSLTSAPNTYNEIRPKGPLLNNLFQIKYHNNDLWGVSGGYSSIYNFIGGERVRTGISRLKDNKWQNIPYDSISNNIENPIYLSHIAINPIQPNQVFVSSYSTGLIEFDNNIAVRLFDENNSTLEPFFANFKLTATSTYDSKGTLWLMNGRVDKPLNKYENDTWKSFDFSELITSSIDELGFSNIIIDDSDNLFIGSASHGVIAFQENNGNPVLKNISKEDENMPNTFVTSLAMDQSNQLWIGTIRGLRVLFNTSSIFTEENITVDEIIIEEDGIAKELFFEQFISDIEVDGSNNKWIGTNDSGLFYLSSDGQNTIFHFTTDNSPLPSNSINDVSIDNVNGVVYIATANGLLSFNSGSSSALEDLSSAYTYPNPVRPGFNLLEDKVKIKDISENINIKITDIEGNLVAEAQSRINQRHEGHNLEIDGGTAYWNGRNLANNTVASGVYLVMLSDLDTFETKVLKLMVVR